jgi:hypothetical protein
MTAVNSLTVVLELQDLTDVVAAWSVNIEVGIEDKMFNS